LGLHFYKRVTLSSAHTKF